MIKMIPCFIGLGGNFPHTLETIAAALITCSQVNGIYNLRSSRAYQTTPVQVNSDHSFFNAVASFETELPLLKLFSDLEDIEKKLGKVRKEKNSSRLIDIDLLFYGDLHFKNEMIEIPHPRLHERLFVLAPLSDLTDTYSLMKNYRNIHNEQVTPLPIKLPFYTDSDAKIGKWQGGALNGDQAKPSSKQLKLFKVSDADGAKFSGCPTQTEIFES